MKPVGVSLERSQSHVPGAQSRGVVFLITTASDGADIEKYFCLDFVRRSALKASAL